MPLDELFEAVRCTAYCQSLQIKTGLLGGRGVGLQMVCRARGALFDLHLIEAISDICVIWREIGFPFEGERLVFISDESFCFIFMP